ncbi:hypothetical protein Mgra_00009405, partial [Meloidogyne graminicola]
ICVWVQQPGSVLTWDFDIIKGECEFVIYYSEKKISSKTSNSVNATATASSHPSTAAATPGPLDRVVDTAIECEPEFKVGDELNIIGHPLDFKETDSMQGTTYCDKAGTYILQWRHPTEFATSDTITQKKESLGESGTTSAPTQPKPSTSGPTHKCRLMVYYELLNSKDFRGSVASLESCRSSFNSLAAAIDVASSSPLHTATSSNENKSKGEKKHKDQNFKKDSNAGVSIEEDSSTATEKTLKS